MNRKTFFLTVLLVMVVLAYTGVVMAAGKTIGIIQYVEHNALDASREGFIKALEDSGFVIGEDVDIDYQNAQGDAANLSTISDRFVARKVDLVLAIATPAAQSIAGKTMDIPILATAVTDFEVARLVDSNEVPGGNVTGTTDMNPIRDQIALLLELVPEAKKIGLLYTSSEDNSVLQAQIAKKIIMDLGLEYQEVTISNSNEVQQAAQSLARKVDALYIPTDNIVASSMPVVYGVSVDAKLPVINGEENQVVNGGLATLGVNYFDLGYQTGLMAVRIFNGEEPSTMPIEGARGFDYIINGGVAEEIGLAIPEHLLEHVVHF
ncbi:MAG: ABC transporter substrate-binding protein [Bacillota bacterium]|nr:ABC transporter substrate-binding protein [Bacillota bacterium]HHU61480.1 ABC transporter substrate-binding protein [Natronincola sp.]